MLVSTLSLSNSITEASYAIDAFDVYNLEGIRTVDAAFKAQLIPFILQAPFGGLKISESHLARRYLVPARNFAKLIRMR